MSIASYFFVASLEIAQKNDGFSEGAKPFKAEFYRVHDTSLKPLCEALGAKDCKSFKLVSTNEDYSQLTFVFPSAFVESLASFDMTKSGEVVEAWSKSEEAPYDNTSDLSMLLESLHGLAKISASSNQDLYLWNAL